MKRSWGTMLAVAALLVASVATPAVARIIDGTSGPDVLVGSAKADTIHGYGSADRINGKGGADRIYGEGGADAIDGGKDTKRDRLYGGSGNDRIHAHTGDTVYAGSGNDTVWILQSGWMAMTTIDCGSGRDHVYGVEGARSGWLHSIAKNCELVD